ncbi:(2Fe-2S)-binding protein [Roseibium sp. M-1]
MFKRLHEPESAVSLTVDGAPVMASLGDSVATVLLTRETPVLRISPETGTSRGIYCGMGVCFDCLVTIDGVGSRQACLTRVAEGMVVTTGQAARNLMAEENA